MGATASSPLINSPPLPFSKFYQYDEVPGLQAGYTGVSFHIVISTRAGIQVPRVFLDVRFREHDG
jgi:hypothetical protein